MIIAIFIVSITTGAFALISQAIGAGDARDASDTTRQVILLASGFGITTGLIGYSAAESFLDLLSMPDDVVTLGAEYLHVFFIGAPVLAFQFAVSACFQASGDTRTPFFVNLVVNLFNIVFSYALIFGRFGMPALGVAGAAWGTVVARIVGSAALVAILYSGRSVLRMHPGSFRPNVIRIRKLLRIGVPSGIEGIFRDASHIVLVKLVALTSDPTSAVAAFSIGYQLMRIPLRTSLGFGIAASTLVGQAIGERDAARASHRGWRVIFVAIGTAVVLAALLATFARECMMLFTTSEPVIEIGIHYLYAIAISAPLTATIVCAGGSLRGAGDTKPGLYYTVLCQWGVLLPLGWLLAFPMEWDADGLWLAVLVSAVCHATLMVATFNRGRWQTLSLDKWAADRPR